MTLTRVRGRAARVVVAFALVMALTYQAAAPAEALHQAVPAMALRAAGGVVSTGIGAAAGTAAVVVGGALVLGWAITGEWPWQWFGNDPDPEPSATDRPLSPATVLNQSSSCMRPDAYENPLVGAPSFTMTLLCGGGWYVIEWRTAGCSGRDATGTCQWVDDGTYGQSPTFTGVGQTKTFEATLANYWAVEEQSIIVQLRRWQYDGVRDCCYHTFIWNIGAGPDVRSVQARGDCVDAAGVVTPVEASTPYALSDPVPPVPALSCPTGTRLSSYSAERVANGVTREIGSWTQPATWSDPGFAYAACIAPTADGSAPCALSLVQLEPDGTYAECTVTLCRGWSTDPAREDNYRCLWDLPTVPLADRNVVPLTDCLPYAHTWESPSSTTTTTVVFEDGFMASPNPTDPTLATDNTAQPSTETTSEAGPSGAETFGSPVAGESPDAATAGQQCFPQGWGLLNPVDWVLRPGKCALSWAFVPSAATATQVETLGQTLATRAPFSAVVAAAGWVGSLGSVGETCWTEDLVVTGYPPLRVIDSCSTEGVWGWLADHRALTGTVLHLSFFVPLAWWAWRSYAPGTIQGG